jgi:DNA-binding NarL/FixJ family response regulator
LTRHVNSHVADAPARVRVLVVSEVRFVRDALTSCLTECACVDALGGVSSVHEVLSRLESVRPEIVLVDLSRPDGLAAIRTLAAGCPDVSIVAFAVSGEHDILACAEAGAAGYVPHDASIDDLVVVVQGVSRGELPCSPRMAASLFRHLATLAAHGVEATSAVLTSRERQIALLIERGLSNKEIGRSLHIELATVKNHVHSILEKFGVPSRVAAAARLRGSSTLLRDSTSIG